MLVAGGVAGAAVGVIAILGPSSWSVGGILGAVALAVAGGVVALCLAVRTARTSRQRLRAVMHDRLMSETRRHGAQLSDERTHHLAVLDTMAASLTATRTSWEAAMETVGEQRIQLGKLKTTVSSLRGDTVALASKLAERDATEDVLRAAVDDLRVELDALRGGPSRGETRDDAEGDADVVGLPRRRAGWDALPTADELWSDGDYPTVADLRFVDAV